MRSLQACIVANNTEVPPFAYIALYASCNVNAEMSTWCTVIYTFLRVVYVVMAACALQPFRSIAWVFSNVTVIVCLIGAIAKAGEQGEAFYPGIGVNFAVITAVGGVLAILIALMERADPDRIKENAITGEANL